MDQPPPPPLCEVLAPGQALEIWCGWSDCRHEARWTSQEAFDRLGRQITIREAGRRLRCAACGRRGHDKRVRCRPDPNFGWRQWQAAMRPRADREACPGLDPGAERPGENES